MRRSVTDHIPKEGWRKLNEPSMIERPSHDSYVFCKVVRDGVDIYDNGQEVRYDLGSCLFARYGVVRDLVSEGKVDLLM